MDQFTVKTKYWHPLEDGRIQCDLCPRFCKMREGQRGLCFVRANQNQQIVSTTYGRSSGFCVDPIEKKPLNHFLPGSAVLSFGTAGCNLACKFCQNWDMSKSREIDKLASVASPQQVANIAAQLNCKSIAFTYNDPVIFMEYAIDIAKACHEKDIKTVAVTAGYICPKPRQEFFQHIDAANVDLKAFSEKFYRKVTGSELQPVLDTLIYIKNHTNTWLEITTLLIPEQNDSIKEISAMCQWIVDNLGTNTPLHFTAFHPDYKMKDIPATPLTTLIKAHDIAKQHGIRYVYCGNVHNIVTSSSYCHTCGQCIIKRDWHKILDYKLDYSGHCSCCATKCAGIFLGPLGDFNGKRLAVNVVQE